MRNIYLLGVAILLSSVLVAQEKKEEKKKPVVKFSGYIAYRTFMDTYESVEAREGNLYLYPQAEKLDDNGQDINAVNQLEAITLDTRLTAKISGPDAFGAKVNGLVEADWNGTSNNYTRMPRLRHAMIKLSWEKASVIAGQYWHPMFTAACFPKTISFGAALPFNPLNRTPQARFTYDFTENFQVLAAASTYGYHNFSAADPESQRNSGMPDFHGQIMYKSDAFTVGLVGGVKSLMPRTKTDEGYKTTKKLTSPDVKGFLKVKVSNVSLKTAFIYGENMTPYVMIGGFGAIQQPDSNQTGYADDYDYSALKTMSVWFDGEIKLEAIKLGFFAGYSSILGANDDYYTIKNFYDGEPKANSTRTANLDNIIRISPRITYTSGKVSLSVEYMYSAAVYGTNWDVKYNVIESADATVNHRTMLAIKYAF